MKCHCDEDKGLAAVCAYHARLIHQAMMQPRAAGFHELTLEEIVDVLPEDHPARLELAELRQGGEVAPGRCRGADCHGGVVLMDWRDRVTRRRRVWIELVRLYRRTVQRVMFAVGKFAQRIIDSRLT